MPRESEAELLRLLALRYPANAYALFPQVRSRTGYGPVRTADAVALSLWPSRGLHLHGFELKSYRSDWLKELQQPEKADVIAAYCNYWWVVAGPDIVNTDELPPAWGLLVAKGNKLRVKVQAPQRKAEPLTVKFIAAMLRRAQDKAGLHRLIKTMQANTSTVVEDTAQLRVQRQLENERVSHNRLKQRVADFEKASGVRIERYDHKDIGAAVNQLLYGSVKPKQQVQRVRQQIVHILESIDAVK